MFYYSRDRRGEHPQAHLANYSGILQADAFGGYTKLYEPQRSPGPIREAACWVHARRPFFAMADLEENARRKAAGKKEIAVSPIAIEVVRRIDALFAIERSINGQSADHRKAVRQAQSAPLVADLEAYMREQCAKLSRGHDLAKAMNYMFKRWGSFTRFLDDGRVCLSNNAAERALRGIALGRKSWLFCCPDSLRSTQSNGMDSSSPNRHQRARLEVSTTSQQREGVQDEYYPRRGRFGQERFPGARH
jgi:hypothetical protein